MGKLATRGIGLDNEGKGQDGWMMDDGLLVLPVLDSLHGGKQVCATTSISSKVV